jgi:hypothetical protein
MAFDVFPGKCAEWVCENIQCDRHRTISGACAALKKALKSLHLHEDAKLKGVADVN